MDVSEIEDGFTMYWRIENFCLNSSQSITNLSPEINVKTLNSNWQIDISQRKDYLAIYLFKMSNPIGIYLTYSVSLLTGSGWNKILKDYRNRFELNNCGYGEETLFSLKELKKNEWFYLPNGSLTISFHIWHRKFENETTQCLLISRMIDECNLLHRPVKYFSNLKPSDLFSYPLSYNFDFYEVNSVEVKETKKYKTQPIQTDTNADFEDAEDLLKLFNKKEFSFVTLRTPNGKFTVHKAVLCAKSPVFSAMLGVERRENDSNLIDITDIESETMASLINFLHFQPFCDLNWESTVKLYYAADKYQIDALKKECVSLLKKELSVENVCDAFLLADLHQDKDLMSCAQEFFCDNSKVIFPTKQWRDMMNHTDLVVKILCNLSEKI